MADTSEIQLSLAAIWKYLRTHVVDDDIGPYPQKQIVIGGGVGHRKPDAAVEIARQDALAACVAWKTFVKGDRKALSDPRLGHVMETLGYMSGLRSGLPFEESVRFGEWLSNKITGWTDGETAEADVRQLERVAKQAAFRPAVKAVLDSLRTEQPPTKPIKELDHAEGIVSKVVCSPLSAVGTVRGARVGINIYLHKPEATGIEFMDPKVSGFAIPGRLEVEMGDGFERIPDVPISKESVTLVTGAPQQSIVGNYLVDQGENCNTVVITPTTEHGLSVDDLMTTLPGAKKDPILQRGLKVIHIGLFQSPFRNWSERGDVSVRIFGERDKLLHQGCGSVEFLPQAVPQIHPTNLSDERRNHNWQRIKPGDVLGQTVGTVPISLMLFDKAVMPPQGIDNFKLGIVGAGVLSMRQLQAMDYRVPAELARYTGGLIMQSMTNNCRLDPTKDRIIGGVIEEAPAEAQGQELRTLERDGKMVLSRPTVEFDKQLGELFGGAIMQLQFIAGNKPGKYRPTFALLRDPADLSSGDGSSYTYTIVVE